VYRRKNVIAEEYDYIWVNRNEEVFKDVARYKVDPKKIIH